MPGDETGPRAGRTLGSSANDGCGRGGYLDVVAACELAHLAYFQNPGETARDGRWPHLLPPVTLGRGSFIRVFLADFDDDGRPEVVAANKGAQSPDFETAEPTPISWFERARAEDSEEMPL